MGGVLDPSPPLEASLVDVRQKQGWPGWGQVCSLWTRKDAGPFFPFFLLLPPILSLPLPPSSPSPPLPPSPFSPSSFSFNKKLL